VCHVNLPPAACRVDDPHAALKRQTSSFHTAEAVAVADADKHRRQSGRSRESRILASNRASPGYSAAVRPTEGVGGGWRMTRASGRAAGVLGRD